MYHNVSVCGSGGRQLRALVHVGWQCVLILVPQPAACKAQAVSRALIGSLQSTSSEPSLD